MHEAAEAAVGANDTMTRHDQWDRIRSARCTDRSRRAAEVLGHLAIGTGRAARDIAKRAPYGMLIRRPHRRERQIDRMARIADIRKDLASGFVGKRIRRTDLVSLHRKVNDADDGLPFDTDSDLSKRCRHDGRIVDWPRQSTMRRCDDEALRTRSDRHHFTTAAGAH